MRPKQSSTAPPGTRPETAMTVVHDGDGGGGGEGIEGGRVRKGAGWRGWGGCWVGGGRGGEVGQKSKRELTTMGDRSTPRGNKHNGEGMGRGLLPEVRRVVSPQIPSLTTPHHQPHPRRQFARWKPGSQQHQRTGKRVRNTRAVGAVTTAPSTSPSTVCSSSDTPYSLVSR